ncbi:hypothetical protein B0T16DRAFT_449409 [Cercophora newfieldiana]|uniref:F5/8 type C domain-containing protein n=1 Tax=Cercophora newfieldiana TaxID=92897 RepID=A0AA39XXN3_9PEZI|nr:hypothetical protein B0T16DRAFT_449409 [Cercophora newfieldiana]
MALKWFHLRPLSHLFWILFAVFPATSAQVHHINDQIVLGPAGNRSIRILSAAPPLAATVLKNPTENDKKWQVVQCSSSEKDNGCDKALDGNKATWWQSTNSRGPHFITIDLRGVKRVTAIRVVPTINGVATGGSIAGHRVLLSTSKDAWTAPPVAYGRWFDDQAAKWAIFEPQDVQFVRLEATSATRGKNFVMVDEIEIWVTKSLPVVPSDGSLGRWGPTINFPLVPVGAFIDPIKFKATDKFAGSVVAFSSDSHDGAGGAKDDDFTATWVSTWDRADETVSQRHVKNTKHQMFCPGMAFDVKGGMIITGGNTDEAKTTRYDPQTKKWLALSRMDYTRGYQGSVTVDDGGIFVIGGSWFEKGGKNRPGEIYDPSSDKWRTLDNLDSERIKTKTDGYPSYRADNHVWLFGWKENSIFHAGPSSDMHWITDLSNQGKYTDAGTRGDDGAMCGAAVMYDAAEGKILTTGGAAQYEYYMRNDTNAVFTPPTYTTSKPSSTTTTTSSSTATLPDLPGRTPYGKLATGRTFHVQLNAIGEKATITETDPLNHARTFHNVVVLPNGDVFVAGGMVKGEPFHDETAVLTPEMWSPVSKTWKPMAPNSIPRTYHSFSLLLQDGTVLVGGGGLSGTDPCNHYDAQIYTPPYLSPGRGPRPVIQGLSLTGVKLDGELLITTDVAVVDASLIRYGAATHTVNNDQRRIRLALTSVGTGGKFVYKVVIPAKAGVAIPGYWMLFVMNGKGVPSVAETVQILCEKCKVGKSV